MVNTIEHNQSNVSLYTALIGSTSVPTTPLPAMNQDMINPNPNNADNAILRYVLSHQDSFYYDNMQSNQTYSIPSSIEDEPIVKLKIIGSIRIKIGKKTKLGFSGIVD